MQKKLIEGKSQMFKFYEKIFSLSNNKLGKLKQRQLLNCPVRAGKMTNTANTQLGKAVGKIVPCWGLRNTFLESK